jgi:alpha-amylase/alpha-mannosidase (GH57 family)
MGVDRVRLIASSILLVAVFLSSISIVGDIVRASSQRIYVAFIWHYHQPWYYSPDETHFVLPWVRMHSVGNYYKMAYILSKYPDIKVTFTFSGSLLEQLVDYVLNGKMDKRQIISWKIVNGTITLDEVFEMLRIPGGFFDINWARIVNRSPRYRQLRDLAQSLHAQCAKVARTDQEYKECVVNGFTRGDLLGQNVVDLAVLFNALWVDPQVAREEYPEIYELQKRAYTQPEPRFTRQELELVLNTHVKIMGKIVDIYRNLVERGQVELIPVPYSHPLAPLLTAGGLSEDLEIHVVTSIELFKKLFNYTPIGVWPAEQAVNEHVVRAFRKAGAVWTTTDQSQLAATGVNAGDIENLGVPWYIEFPEGRVYIVFRETTLSNLISFQYSGWDQDRAVEDLVNRILSYASTARGPRLVVIALDGENPWEHYPEFGTIFLNKLYAKLTELQKQGLIETITPGEFIRRFSGVAKELPAKNYPYLDLAGKDISDIPPGSYGDGYYMLPRKVVTARLPEGSWGGDLAIWIGHRQENVAYMWLVKAREDIMRKLGATSFRELYERHPDVARYLLKAEASDWWWWYGYDGGGSPAPFDPLFKAYLSRAYELAGLKPPDYLKTSALPDGQPIGAINPSAPLLLDKPPKIDGDLGEWSSLVDSGRALKMVVGVKLSEAYVALDRSRIYFAFNLTTCAPGVKIGVYLATPAVSMSPYSPGFNVYPRGGRVDLGIHLAREILVDIGARELTTSTADGFGGWVKVKTEPLPALVISPRECVVEFSVNILDLKLSMGEYAYVAIVLYEGETPVEWSSRLGLAYMLSIPRPPPEAVGTVLMDVEDPVGDDDGPGGYTYPKNRVFQPGVFDLTRFTLVDLGDRLLFKFVFRNLGGNPWGGPNGWSMQQIHVFIKTSLPAEGRKDTLLNVEIAHGWHMMIIVAPGWGTDPVPKGERTALYYYDRDEPVVQDGELKPYCDQATNSIYVEVSKRLLYDVENVEKWIIAVLVTSHDGYGVNRIRPFTIGGGEWEVGVPEEYSLAVAFGVHPYVLDLLAPTAQEQYQMLRSFDPAKKELAKVYGIPVKPTPSTPTPTPTPQTSPTPTVIIPLPSPITIHSPSPTPTPVETPQPAPDHTWIIAAIVAVIAVIALGALLAKRRSK